MHPNQTKNKHHFLTGGGEMGDLIRAYDWTHTPLGIPERWPQSLRTTLSIILRSKFPMFLFWGEDLLCFYNDAYRPSLGNEGKHPYALGKPGVEVWPEIWEVIKPLIDQVMAGGEASWSEDQFLPIYRNGQLEDVYWTFSYSPVNDESDRIAGVFVTCTETTRAVQSRQALIHSAERFHKLVTQAPVAIALFRGPQFITDLINERMLKYLGRSLEQMVNKPLFEAIPESIGQGYEGLLNKVLTTGEPVIAHELTVDLFREGQLQKTYIDFVFEPYYENDRTIQGVMVVANEITQQVIARQQVEERVLQRTQELAHAIDDLRRSNENLQQFAYIASHDLQEPLRKVQQFGDLLKKQYASELGEGISYLERIHLATNRMSMLIKDLLAFARISTRQEATASVSLNEVVKTVLTDLELTIQETNAVVVADLLPTVLGDVSQLGQLFQNLLSNALKFQRPGVSPSITIRSYTVAATELPAWVKPSRLTSAYYRIDVADNGIGFDEKYLDRIFQVFQRLHGRNEYDGTGIGLAICEKVTANHGGFITARSQPGQGATFQVYIPI